MIRVIVSDREIGFGRERVKGEKERDKDRQRYRQTDRVREIIMFILNN